MKDKVWVEEIMRNFANVATRNCFKDGKRLPERFILYRLKNIINDFIFSSKEYNRLILMPGIRGVGKTTVLSQLYLYLIEDLKIPQERVIFLSVDSLVKVMNSSIYDFLQSYEKSILLKYLSEIEEPIFLLLDEVHYDEKWPFVLKMIYDTAPKVFVVATGSSALSLMSTADLARRATVEELFPLNFSEYLMLEKGEIKSYSKLRSFVLDLIFNPSLIDNLRNDEEIRKEYSSFVVLADEIRVRRFLKYGGFPFSPFYDERDIVLRVKSVLDKIIEEDIRKLGNFKSETLEKLWRFLILITSSPEISIHSLSNQIGLSKTVVSQILRVLENSSLLFSLKPLGGEEKIAKKAWRYYFLTPTIRSSIKQYLGTFKEEDFGILFEEYVASIFFRIGRTKTPISLFFDAEKGGADLIIKTPVGKPIPVEVKFGDKSEKQVLKSMKKFNSPYGIVIGNFELKFEDNILYMPRNLFLVL
jgi:predicted AAA+ superfamily ATPase